ncbi:MAG: DNA primase [Planctomycetota bacterium]
MAGFIGEEQVRRVKEVTDLADLVGGYTTIRRAGHDFKACCPIHQERTPSLHIYVDQQTYHCFGCGAHGDAISLVRDMENLDFVEAVEFLARRAGIQITYDRGRGGGMQRSERDRLLQVHEWATGWYEEVLWRDADAAAARRYLAERGLEQDTCRAFRLGWAPGRGRLLQAAQQEGIATADLMRLDLVLQRDDGRRSDRFFERLLFPIADRFGHPIAFSGRLLPEAQRQAEAAGRGVGKYINSRDTPLYHKGGVVFNLHRARRAARRARRLLVMEGPTDVMAAHQGGIEECAAVLGTALTGEHARQLGALVGGEGSLILLFDGDAAGQANSIKAVKTCLQTGVPARAAVLPPGQDPAELIAAEGAAAFEALLRSPVSDIDHLLRALAPRPFELDQRQLLGVLDEVLEPLRGVQDPELQRLYLESVADYLDLDRERVSRRLRGSGTAVQRRTPVAAATRPDGVDAPALTPEQDAVLHVLVRYPDLRCQAFDDEGCEPRLFPEPWQRVVMALLEEPDCDQEHLMLLPVVQDCRPVHAAVFRWLQRPLPQDVDDESGLRGMLQEALRCLRQTAMQTELKRAEHALREAQRSGDQAHIRTHFATVMELQRACRTMAGLDAS